MTRTDLETALRYFELALAKDPTYALAYLGVHGVWAGGQQMGFFPPAEAQPRMNAAMAKALELDDTLPRAHFQLAAQTAWTDWNFAAAESGFLRAIDLNPNEAHARAYYAHYLHIMKRPGEAAIQIQRAIELDPLNPLIQGLYGGHFLMVRRFDEALDQYRNALRSTPDSPLALIGVANALYHLGKYDDALNAENMLWTARGDSELGHALSSAVGEAGYQSAMRRAADILAARPSSLEVGPMSVTRLYLRAGRNDLALDWLERSYQARDPALPYLNAGYKEYDAVRSHPRFQALVRRLGLPM